MSGFIRFPLRRKSNLRCRGILPLGFTSGAKVSEFEEALAAYVGMPRAVAANSGTSSLHLAAMAAGIRRGDEVIVPTLAFIAAVNPLTRYVGAEPIFIGCNDTLH